MKADSRKPAEEPSTEPGSVEQEAQTCPVCGTKFFATGFCPVCILRGAASGESAETEEEGPASGLAAGPAALRWALTESVEPLLGLWQPLDRPALKGLANPGDVYGLALAHAGRHSRAHACQRLASPTLAII